MCGKFNFLHQMGPIYYLPVVCLGLTCGGKETCAPTPGTPKPPKPFVEHSVGPNTTQTAPTPTTKSGLMAVTPSSKKISSASPATQGSRSASSSSTAPIPPATQGNGPASPSSPATQDSGKTPASSPKTIGNENTYSSSIAAPNRVSASPLLSKSNEDHTAKIQAAIANVNNEANKATLADVMIKINRDTQTGLWYTEIEWTNKTKWNNWLRGQEYPEWSSWLKKKKLENQLAYFKKVNEFLPIHLKENQDLKNIFENLQRAIQEADEIVNTAKQDSVFNSDTNLQETINQALNRLTECNRLSNTYKETMSGYFAEAQAFQQRCREVFEAVLTEMIKEQRNNNKDRRDIISHLTEILGQLPLGQLPLGQLPLGQLPQDITD